MRTTAVAAWAVALGACSGPVGEGDGVVDADEVPGIGWTATFETLPHDVAGTAEIVDEETIELRDFTFDGGGVNARLFLVAAGARFSDDFELTDNLVGTVYDGDTFTVDIPDDAPFEESAGGARPRPIQSPASLG